MKDKKIKDKVKRGEGIPSKDLKDLLPKPRAATDLEVMIAGGIKALKEKFIREEGPELMNKATIFGLSMNSVAVIVSAVKNKLDKDVDWNSVEPEVLKDAVNQLLGESKSSKH